MEMVWHDLRYGWRMVLKARGMTLAAVLILALGIGVNVTIFAFLNALFLSSIPFADPERVVYLWSSERPGGQDRLDVSLADFRDWQGQSELFAALAAFSRRSFNVASNPPERLLGLEVTSDFFSVVGAGPSLGRISLASEMTAAGNRAVVLGDDLWRQRFAGDTEIIGQTILLNATPFTVIGVMPPEFWFPSREVKLWTLIDLEAAGLERGAGSATVIGLLKPAATLAEARVEMDTIARRLAQEYPATNTGRGVNVVPVSWELLGPSDRMAVILFGFTTVCVLLVACINVGNLLLVWALARRRELGVRVALGAGRLRLIRQFLTESLLLALVGGALALLLSRWAASILLAVFPHNTPDPAAIVDGRVVGFTLTVALLSTLLFGFLPAWRASRPNVLAALQEGTQSSGSSRRSRRLYKTLVIAQINLSLVLLIVSGLMIRTLNGLYRMNPGFETANILTVRIDSPAELPYDQAGFYSRALDRIKSIPGVVTASAVSQPPFVSGAPTRSLTIAGRSAATPGAKPRALVLTVSPDYFPTLGIPVVKGRGLTSEDNSQAAPVAMINEAMVRRYWGANDDPLAARIRFGDAEGAESEGTWISVVGVVQDVRRVHPAFAPRPQVYLPVAQFPRPSMALVIRTASDPLGVAAVVRSEMSQFAKDQPVYEIRELRRILRDLLAVPWTFVGMLGVFACLAAALATVGIYGVVSYSLGQRTHEIGIRIALGATPGNVRRLLLREGLVLAVSGIVSGFIIAFGLSRFIASRFHGVRADDLVTFVGVIVVLMGVALAAAYIPARRAATIEPMEALRQE